MSLLHFCKLYMLSDEKCLIISSQDELFLLIIVIWAIVFSCENAFLSEEFMCLSSEFSLLISSTFANMTFECNNQYYMCFKIDRYIGMIYILLCYRIHN